MCVRRECFQGHKAENIYKRHSIWRLMRQAEYSVEEMEDTACEISLIFACAAICGGYDVDFSDCGIERNEPHEEWRHVLCDIAADVYILRTNPAYFYALREAFHYIDHDTIKSKFDRQRIEEACVEGGVIEMLDAWIAGVPIVHTARLTDDDSTMCR